jgi:hypothetical protein
MGLLMPIRAKALAGIRSRIKTTRLRNIFWTQSNQIDEIRQQRTTIIKKQKQRKKMKQSVRVRAIK